MPRIRSVKPQFWSDEKIGKLSVEARCLFIGIWNFADDEGILQWTPTYLRSCVFPHDNYIIEDITDMMDQLVKLKLMRVYKSRKGDNFAQVANFCHHQSPNNPKPSTLPRPRRRTNDRNLDIKSYHNETVLEPNKNNSHSAKDKGIRNKDKGIRNNPLIVPPKGGRGLRYVLQNTINKEKINVRADNNIEAINQTPWPMDETIVFQRPK